MDFGDPAAWSQTSNAINTALDTFRSAVDLVRSLRSKTATPQEADAIESALSEAEKAAKIAEAQVAKALGYEFCRCAFPPTAMLTVGTWNVRGAGPRSAAGL